MCPLYVAGLIGSGDRKSIGPMAERVAPGDYDRLHHFVSDGVWDAGPLEFELSPPSGEDIDCGPGPKPHHMMGTNCSRSSLGL